MKKTLMFLAIASCAGSKCADQGFAGIKKENVHIHETDLKNLYPHEEYESVEDFDDNTEEYEQHVCDNVKPPKVSAMQAYLTSMAGSVLIKVIIMKEIAHTYFVELKELINSWFGLTIKK